MDFAARPDQIIELIEVGHNIFSPFRDSFFLVQPYLAHLASLRVQVMGCEF